MSECATGRDADYTEERLINVYNTDLANTVGNLLNRSLSMTQQYRAGRLRRDAATAAFDARFVPVGEERSRRLFARLARNATELPIDGRYAEGALEIARRCNLQIQEQARGNAEQGPRQQATWSTRSSTTWRSPPA